MRNLSNLLFVLLAFSCSTYEHVVDSDYSYDATFHKYKSFYFASNTSFSGSEEEKTLIEKYLKNTLQAWGYNYQDKRPNLLVYYSVFYEDFVFPGYNQPQFQDWLKENYADQKVIFKKDTLPDGNVVDTYVEGGNYHEEDYEKKVVSLKEGTILITLYDRRKHKSIWHGYASGVFGSDQDKNERIMKSAVIRILDEYKLMAFGAS